MATREADLDLGGDAKKKAGGRKSLLMIGGGALPLAGCVLTKLDECLSLGAALSVVIRHRLPVACVTDGQSVPEYPRPACARDLASVATQRVHARAEQAAGGAPALALTARRVAAHA